MVMETIIFCFILAATVIYLRVSRSRKYDSIRLYPPGPKPLPLVGNVLDIPTSHEYFTYTKWGRKYGDVVYVNALGKHLIILNSAKAANELLEQRSAIYSDRPYLPMMHDTDL